MKRGSKGFMDLEGIMDEVRFGREDGETPWSQDLLLFREHSPSPNLHLQCRWLSHY
jgi:hypothetical protein